MRRSRVVRQIDSTHIHWSLRTAEQMTTRAGAKTMPPKPQITEAQRVCDRLKADCVVILAFSGDHVGGASYGTTKNQCRIVGEWMDLLISQMCSGHMAPPYIET
jgi:hypothetical protein